MSRMTVSTRLIMPMILWVGTPLWAQATSQSPSVTPGNSGISWFTNTDPVELLDEASKPEKLSASLEIILVMTVLALVPAILVMTTSFTRIIVVLALLRQAIGTQQLPPSQVLTGLALFMTFCVMTPTWNQINNDAIQPYVNPADGAEPIDRSEAWVRAKGHIRNFMITQIDNTGNTEDVYMFAGFGSPNIELQNKIKDESLQWQDITMSTLIPAFITSELKQAFLMGFYVYLPFLIIDMVIASILMSMGMMMLPPVLISLPFKLLLFVLVDGWHLVIGSLLDSFTNNAPF
jgi:flagellar biosynthetic protein FliP